MTTDTVYITKDGDMLDMICAAHYGETGGYVEAVLSANYGLADKGFIYPAGIAITLPVIAKPSKQRVNLFD